MQSEGNVVCLSNSNWHSEPTKELNPRNAIKVENGSEDIINIKTECKNTVLDLSSLHSELKIESDDDYNDDDENYNEATSTEEANRRKSLDISESHIKKNSFVCKICSKSLSSRDNLVRHQKIHTGIKFKCKICPNEYSRLDGLKLHEKTIHGKHVKIRDKSKDLVKHSRKQKKSTITCDICSKSYSSNNWLRHQNVHNGVIFKCKICSKECARRDTLKRHEKIHRQGRDESNEVEEINRLKCSGISAPYTNERWFVCKICSKAYTTFRNLRRHEIDSHISVIFQCKLCPSAFDRSESLKKHENKYHNTNTSKPHTNEKSNETEETDRSKSLNKKQVNICEDSRNNSELITCDICSKNFSHIDFLKKHQLNHTNEKPFSCQECSETFIYRRNLKIHELKHKGLKVNWKDKQCKICRKVFSQPDSLLDHLRIHTGEKPFKCDQCSETFTYKSGLITHKARIHIGKREYKCTTCSKQFFTSKDLHKHKRVHESVRPYLCAFCGKRCKKSEHLKIHEQIHIEEKLYECNECSRAFSQKNSLTVHMTNHHTKTAKQSYKCDVCSKTYSSHSGLRRHKEKHDRYKPTKSYKCWCSKEFYALNKLNRHRVVHTGDKPYQCDICLMRFTQKYSVTRHKKIHTDKKT